MPSEFCSDHTAHKQAIARNEKRLDSHSKQISDVKDNQANLQLIVQKLTDIQGQNTTLLAELEQRVSAIEEQPIKTVQRVKDAALAAFGGAIGTGLIALLVLALIRSVEV